MVSRSAQLLVAFVAMACAGSSKPPAISARPVTCEVVPTPNAPPDSIVVVATMAIEPGDLFAAPNAAERFVAAHAYETLVRADCEGTASPGISDSWRADSTRTHWTFTLRDGARFWNGDPVTAGAVVDAWRAIGAAPTAMLARRIANATTILNERTLLIALPDSQPFVLSDPELIVARRDSQSPWPQGTGRYRVRVPLPGASGAALDRMLQLIPVEPRSGQILTIRTGAGTVARDLIDVGIDLLITDDPGIASYAGTRPEHMSVPFGPDRTFVLLSHATSSDPPAPDAVERGIGLREALARDAVRASATAATLPAWWRTGAGCDAAPRAEPLPVAATWRPRVVYLRDDPMAAALAARLAALASMPGGDTSLRHVAPELLSPGSRITSAALTEEEFSRALLAGDERGYVLALPRESRSACVTLARLIARAPWLQGEARAPDRARAFVPLIDVAPLVIVRRERMGLTLEGASLRVSTGPRRP